MRVGKCEKDINTIEKATESVKKSIRKVSGVIEKPEFGLSVLVSQLPTASRFLK